MQDNRDSEKFCMAEKKVFWKPLLRIPEANGSLRRGCARLRVWLFLPETRYEAARLGSRVMGSVCEIQRAMARQEIPTEQAGHSSKVRPARI
jgi:hypothetical protein